MGEYLERETAVKAFNNFDAGRVDKIPSTLLTPEESAEYLYELPTVDAVVVTRCKECKHSTLPSELTQRYGKPGTLTCHNMHAPSNRRNVGSNDFCNYGEPKEATAMRTEEKGNG